MLEAARAQRDRDGHYDLKKLAGEMGVPYYRAEHHLNRLRRLGLITDYRRRNKQSVRPPDEQKKLVEAHYLWVEKFISSEMATKSGIDPGIIREMAHDKLMASARLWEEDGGPDKRPAKFSSYLWESLLNGLTNLLRARSVRQRTSSSADIEQIESGKAHSDRKMSAFIAFVHSLHKKGYLSEQHAMGLVLRTVHEWKFHQIAKILGLQNRSKAYESVQRGSRIVRYFMDHERARKKAGLLDTPAGFAPK
ncbi:MAG: hypothetical protein ABIG96_06155 [Candidatus Micrarchaeota archaeon]